MSSEAQVALLTALSTLAASLAAQVVGAVISGWQRRAEFRAQARLREQEINLQRSVMLHQKRTELYLSLRDAAASFMATVQMADRLRLTVPYGTFSAEFGVVRAARREQLVTQSEDLLQRVMVLALQAADGTVREAAFEIAHRVESRYQQDTEEEWEGNNAKTTSAVQRLVVRIDEVLEDEAPAERGIVPKRL